MEKVKAPGLKWRKTATGYTPIWVADEADVKRGYSPKTMNLKSFIDQPEILVAKCNSLQADMLLFRAGYRHDPTTFDGSIRSLLSVYQRHEESPFQKLKPASRRTYIGYIPKLETHVGSRQIATITGIDINRWHRAWSDDGRYLAAAATTRAILEAALTFGVMLRFAGCVELLEICREARKKLPRPSARTAAMTAKQVAAARQAAHADGRPAQALAYAIAFETTLRIWDVIGQWWPMDQGGLSTVLDPKAREKWFGLRWEDIDENLVLKFTPSKTEQTTGRTVSYSLTKAPMVLEELQHWPVEKRKGPVIISDRTGIPYRPKAFAYYWRKDREAAGIPSNVWARDLRASGITEGRASEATVDDAQKVAGHSTRTTTGKVYDRAVLEAADRFADARIKGRGTER